MTEYERTRPRTVSEQAYRLLLHAYPSDFRREFGDAMVEFFHDRIVRAKQEGFLAVWVVWLRAFADVLRNVVPARSDSLKQAVLRVRRRRREARQSPIIHTARRKDWMIASILQDIRYALRGLLRHRAFSLMIIGTLTLGIGANAAIFSVVNGVLLRPLPFRDPRGIVHIRHNAPMGSVSEPEFYDYQRELRAFNSLAAFSFTSANITGEGEPERILGARVSDGFFRVLLKLVVGEGLILGGVGLAVGIVLALSLSRYIKSMLVNTATFDPATFAGVIALLGTVCLLASWVPARRAMAVDPMRALRSD